MMEFIFRGEPIPKARHRSFKRKGHMRTYDPQAEVKESVRWQMKTQIESAMKAANEIVMEASSLAQAESFFVILTFYLPIPKTAAKLKRDAFNSNRVFHTKKPDLDNLVKFYLDCANGILWSDDSKVAQLQCAKYYSNEPHTSMKVFGNKDNM